MEKSGNISRNKHRKASYRTGLSSSKLMPAAVKGSSIDFKESDSRCRRSSSVLVYEEAKTSSFGVAKLKSIIKEVAEHAEVLPIFSEPFASSMDNSSLTDNNEKIRVSGIATTTHPDNNDASIQSASQEILFRDPMMAHKPRSTLPTSTARLLLEATIDGGDEAFISTPFVRDDEKLEDQPATQSTSEKAVVPEEQQKPCAKCSPSPLELAKPATPSGSKEEIPVNEEEPKRCTRSAPPSSPDKEDRQSGFYGFLGRTLSFLSTTMSEIYQRICSLYSTLF